MFGLSGEHLLILAAVLIIFGPRKLPELGASFGRALRNFKEGLNQPSSAGSVETRPVPQDQVFLNSSASAGAHLAPTRVPSTDVAAVPTQVPVVAAQEAPSVSDVAVASSVSAAPKDGHV